jgi:hypothetical protein
MAKSTLNKKYLLKISLLDIKPTIWRTVIVPASISLDRLHDVIQIIMPWLDYHLYDFKIAGNEYGEDKYEESDVLPAEKFRLGDLVKAKGDTFYYTYDFGDNWEHEITVEDNNYKPPKTDDVIRTYFGEPPVECIGGARHSPPEDVGGDSGYYEFCKSIKNPKHAEHKQNKVWFATHGYDHTIFNSEMFDIEEANQNLTKYLRWSRRRALDCVW